MRDIPNCLYRRYKVLNGLIEDITTDMQASVGGPGGCCQGGGPSGGGPGGGGPGGGGPGGSGTGGGGPGGSGTGGSCPGCGVGGPGGGGTGSPCSSQSSVPMVCGETKDEDTEVGTKLMCDFWKILQDDSDSNLTQAVQQRKCTPKCSSANEKQKVCCAPIPTSGGSSGGCPIHTCTPGNSAKKRPKKHDCGATSANKISDAPLRKVLGNLKQAASFEKSCSERLSELLSTQKDLKEQISNLEEKEKSGVNLMKQADCMWSCMEDSYKQTLAESQERYRALQRQLKEVEASTNKWRKNKKDLEFQLKNVNKCSQDMNEKLIQKANDVKIMQLEIEDSKKRIASNQKDLTAVKNSYNSKKDASDARLAKIAEEIQKAQTKIGNECRCKADKESRGCDSVKESRDELQKLCRCLLQKKLENEDLQAEKEALLQEIGLLKATYDTCAVRCAKREKNIVDETARIDKEISQFSAKCIKCHKHTDSSDVMRFCIDCPRCLLQRECRNEGDHCTYDRTKDCVCTRVKEKFLGNVFENMYTVLESEANTCPGKEMADCIFTCLKKSKNGKLDDPTRKILQEFVLSTVKKNLNLTIVGGAVKTRCEMDPDTYTQLMLCLKDVVPTSPVKEDKGTPAKKPPCHRWHSSDECNCPNGPKYCVCTRKARKPPAFPGTCGPCNTDDAVVDSNVKICPQTDSTANGVECGMLGRPNSSGASPCPFAGNMRAAQCVLGPEVLAEVRAARPASPSLRPASPGQRPASPGLRPAPPGLRPTPPGLRPTPPVVPPKKATCISGGKAIKSCHTDINHLKGEVMDNFNEGTTAGYQKTINENLQLKMSLSEAAPAQASLKPISSLQKAILFTDKQQEKILEEFTKNNLNQNETREQFQTVSKNNHGQSDRQFTELTQTPSGKLAIELDEQTIKIIEEKSITDRYLYMSIKTSRSGHVLVDFDTKENVIDKTHWVKVRKTSSGTKLLDIDKNMIRTLKDTLSNTIPNASLSKSIKLPSSPTISESPFDAVTELPLLLMSDKDLVFKGSMGTTYSDLDSPLKGITEPKTTDHHKEHISGPILTEIYSKHEKKKKSKCTCPKTTPDSGSCKLICDTGLMLNNKRKAIPACSCDKSNACSVSCRLISDSPEELITSCWKSSNSRSVDNCNYELEFKQLYKQDNANIAVEIQVKNGEVQKLPAVVTKSKSGTIAINFRVMSSLQEITFDGKECPVFLSKTVSGTYFVRIDNNDQSFNATLIKTPSEGVLLIPQSFQVKHQNGHEIKDFYKVKLSVMTNQLLELPAVLKPTPSNNYLVVLDKEFETCCKDTLREYFGENLEGSVDLHTTNSGNYILEWDNEDESNFKNKNAKLVKTSSGHIKVLVHGPEFEPLVQRKLSISSTSSVQASEQMRRNLPASSREFHRENLRKSKNLDNQTSSKTKLFRKGNGKLQDSLPFVSEPSTILKKTPSGQYAVLLNEESKKSLLNNFQNSSLTSNTEGLVPIKRLDSGEIIINLDNKDEGKSHYGTLKVTPSGNFYVVVDEKVMKDLTESPTKNEVSCSSVGTRSKHATQLIDSVHKAVAPTCQAKLDDCCCDPSSCVCTDRLLDTKDGSNDKLAQLCPCVWKEANAVGVTIRDESDIFFFEPSYDLSPRKNANESTQQCFYWVEASYPHHLGKSEFSQLHKYQSEKKIGFAANSGEPAGQDSTQEWDSLDYLPPQLPYFLKDVKFR